MPGQTVKLAALAGSDLRRAATTRRCTRRTTASPSSTSTATRRRPSASRTATSSSAMSSSRRRRSSQQATERPDGFSPNVLLRPIVQDTLFPTVCYVAGPNELAYLGQLRGVYRALRRADAVDVPAGDGDAARFRGAAVPDEVQAAARGPAGAGRGGAERAAQDARFRRPSKSRSPPRRDAIDDADDAADAGDAGARSDARRRGAIDARTDAARPRRRCTAR